MALMAQFSGTILRRKAQGRGKMLNEDLDALDCRIIGALQADGRLSNVDLAEKVGLSPSPCLRRVNRLERDGFIESYRAVLGRKRIGLGLSVFIGVKIDGHADDRATTFEEEVVAFPEVIACHMISGEADYMLEVAVPDLEAYQRFLVGKLLNLPLVREVRSNIAIQTLKTGAPLPLAHLGSAGPVGHGAVARATRTRDLSMRKPS
jgi:Lrp/AsnC family leucine-responsive transcriptional regulator